MSLLYLIKFTIEYKGIPQIQFIKTWATEADVALKAKEKGKILQIWKVSEKKISLYYLLSLFQRQNWDIGSTIQHKSITQKGFGQLVRRLQRLRTASVKWRTAPKKAWFCQN